MIAARVRLLSRYTGESDIMHRHRVISALFALLLVITSLALFSVTPASATALGSDTSSATAVSCPTSTFCLAADSAGYLYTYTSGTWTQVDSLGVNVTALSWDPSSFCMGGDENGNVFIFANSSISDVTNQPDGSPIIDVSCVSSSFCVVVTDNGNVYATTDEGSNWRIPGGGDVPSGEPLDAVSCATTTLCAVTSTNGDVYVYNGAEWTEYANVSGDRLIAVSCPTSSFCAAADSAGDVFTYNGTSWDPSAQNPITAHTPTTLTCPTASLCLLGDATGDVYADNGGTWAADPANPIDASAEITDLSCPLATLCTVVDSQDNAFTFLPQVVPSTLTISNAPSVVEVGGSFTPSVTTVSDGTTAVIDTTTSVCSLTGPIVTFLTLGTCDLQATTTATAGFFAGAGPIQAITVISVPRLLSQSPLSITTVSGTVDVPLVLETSGGSGAGAITFQVSSTGSAQCTLTSAATLVASAAGSCGVTATKSSDGTYETASSSPTQITFAAAPSSPTPPPKKSTTPTVHVTTRILGPFANDSYALTRPLSDALAALVATARRNHDHRVVIVGYTSASGTSALNRALSLARAKHVASDMRAVFAHADYPVVIIAKGAEWGSPHVPPPIELSK